MAIRIFADMAGSRLANYTNNASIQPCDWIMTIYGPAVNPHVQIGGNRIELTGTIPAGAYATINTRSRTITLTDKNGITTNIFNQGVRGAGRDSGSYCFQPISSGRQLVTWSGSFDFDLSLIEERSDPSWQMD